MALIRWLLRWLRPAPAGLPFIDPKTLVRVKGFRSPCPPHMVGFTSAEFAEAISRGEVYTPPYRPLTMFDWCNTDGTQKRGLITRYGKRTSHIMRVKP